MNQIREAAVAGQFYPGTAAELETAVRAFLDAAQTSEAAAGPVHPRSVIV